MHSTSRPRPLPPKFQESTKPALHPEAPAFTLAQMTPPRLIFAAVLLAACEAPPPPQVTIVNVPGETTWCEPELSGGNHTACFRATSRDGRVHPPPTPTGLYWLAFRDHRSPAAEPYLGFAIVHAYSFEEARRVASLQGIDPGGSVIGHPITEQLSIKPIPPQYIGRLLSQWDVDRLMREVREQQQ